MEDDDLKLSDYAAEALRLFYEEEAERQANQMLLTSNKDAFLSEDWELSQFWYSNETAEILAKCAIDIAGSGRIACVSCPSVFHKLINIDPGRTEHRLFEYDKRFMLKYTDQFIFYDYNDPINFPEILNHAFDVVLIDPPYLSQECLEKVTKTAQFLAKNKIILCTGAVMEDIATKLLEVKPCRFTPKHSACLGNEFKCFANFDLDKYIDSINIKALQNKDQIHCNS